MENNEVGEIEYTTVLVNKYADMVLRLSLAYLGNLTDAQDACQEVYIELFKHQRFFNDAEHEKAWIIGAFQWRRSRCLLSVRRVWRSCPTFSSSRGNTECLQKGGQVATKSLIAITAFKDRKELGSNLIEIKAEDNMLYSGKVANE